MSLRAGFKENMEKFLGSGGLSLATYQKDN